ncbi:uncharacterized protein LOC116304190 [Actinia tenebrosa]|uniref:Uncharacterized protein LOC116304190 n=1 Tax=Actinia tenebrosa TaxID=6105 RepID=A0A6P8IS70_ACTTE|nr:uncharacterized protein LOC116304190 [Actinia tenebrosa]
MPQSPSGSESPDYNNEEFIFNGINLLTHVNSKARKPKLYATALLSILFSDEDMRNGCVEPKDGGSKKPALDQAKIDLMKKCIKIRYGEKLLDKSWSEIRTSLNQKCLDKLKAFRKSVTVAADNEEQ